MQRLAIPVALIALALGTPAHAGTPTSVDGPNDGALFGLGLAGLVIGRHIARRKRD